MLITLWLFFQPRLFILENFSLIIPPFCYIYLSVVLKRQSEREGEVFHPGWARLKPRSQNSDQVFDVGGSDPNMRLSSAAGQVH